MTAVEDVREEAPPVRRRRRSPVRIVVAVAGVAVVGGAAAWAAVGFGGDDGTGAAAAPTGPPATVKIEKRTLTETETVSGTLGFGDTRTATATQRGTVTWVPSDGDTITRGKTVFSVDAKKVPLLYGKVPIYRTLSSGTEGKDVRMLESNLAALGYDGFTVDNDYTSGTAAAVEEWQDDLGRDQTGTVAKGDAIVAPGAIRVATVKANVGDSASGPVLTWTGTGRKVTVKLKTEYEDLVANGTGATVELPDGATVKATVTDVGTAATAGEKTEDATLPVELEIKDQKGLGRYQSSPVDVTFASKSHKDVLAVPVTALVALREGGYAIEVVGAGGVTGYVRVETGMFADSMVEIKGNGLSEGQTVGVPK